MTQPILELRNLTRHFDVGTGGMFSARRGLVRAVEDVSLTLEHGQTLALVGESGCGKTTLARMLLRLLPPTSGQVLVDGQDVATLLGSTLRAFRTKVQAVFQDPWASLSPRMKVFDIVAETLVVNERLTKGELTRRVDEALTSVGLRPEQARLYPHEFSGGQRQRIAIASAIIARPKLMILDEPVSALDVSIRSQIMNLFKDIQTEYGCSYVIVAHDLGTTRYMADRIAVMYLGRLVEVAPTDEIFDLPRHPYTEALLSAALPLRPRKDRAEAIQLSGEVPSPMNPPSGCAFHPRCHRVIDGRCSSDIPVSQSIGPAHRVACHLYSG
ncbi:ATP-binding cassette domain-containing protein [Pseudotabrizicola sediminis]|uniref:ATP-binding cassette domain-containing protein n=1 Tax=Pseudotabrizicola sediminis TaxID=2486418 RepID=A0ABY2KHJ2_9RHOB|nr:oligopeptide/dipeptide ABC transporter ATP-binding protein [Pseudotabrizicola sediminis]TGD41735.1 ATP-binding cassette domain-containing protein [Pseudotabrizicola sediminis]